MSASDRAKCWFKLQRKIVFQPRLASKQIGKKPAVLDSAGFEDLGENEKTIVSRGSKVFLTV
jgi:hypothetical protein